MDNKAIFSANLKRYMELNQKSRKDICDALGFNYYTFSDWVNGKKYPRMDKIERLASYFGIQKSDLIEDKSSQTPSTFLARYKILTDTFNLSISDIQKITGIDKNKLSAFSDGRSEPAATANEIIEIARAFNVSEAWLLGYDVPMERLPASKKLADYELSKRILTDQFSKLEEAEIDEFLNGLWTVVLDEGEPTVDKYAGELLRRENHELLYAAIEFGARLAKAALANQKENKE